MNIKYTDIIQGNGFLTDQGQQILNDKLLPIVRELLEAADSANEVRIIGSLLSNIIGKEVTNMIMEADAWEQTKKAIITEKITTVLKDGLKEFIHPAAHDPFDYYPFNE